jgi:two-component system sensor histidine kinase YesM
MVTYLIVVIVPLALTAILMYQGAVSVVKEQTEKYNYKMLQLMNEKIDKLVTEIDRISYFVYLDDVQSMLNQIPRDPASKISWQVELRNKLNSWIGSLGFNGGIRGVLLIDDNGVYFNQQSTRIRSEQALMQSDWYSEALRSNGSKIILGENEFGSNIEMDPYREGSLHFAIARKVYNMLDNRPLGVLLIMVEMYDMNQIFAELNIDKSTKLLIADSHNEIVYQSGGGRLDLKLDTMPDQWNNLTNPAKVLDNGAVLMNTFKSATTNWSYITLTDKAALTSNAKKMSGIIILIGLFGFGLAILMSYVLSKRIVIPIKRLQASMKNIERNEFRSGIPVGTSDEIGELTDNFNHMVSRIRELINSVYKANIKEKDAQISALQAQINPHFLYNTLDTVNAMAMVEEQEAISTMIVALGEMFKYSMNQNDKIVTVREELEHLDNYMTIQRCRFGERIQFVNEISEEIQRQYMIRLTLQPLVENAIQHGLESAAGGGTIRLSAVKETDRILIHIQDDGRGILLPKLQAIQARLQYNIPDTDEDRKKGIGLLNVHERLKLYFGEQYGLQIQSEYGSGTTVSIAIPVSDIEVRESVG